MNHVNYGAIELVQETNTYIDSVTAANPQRVQRPDTAECVVVKDVATIGP